MRKFTIWLSCLLFLASMGIANAQTKVITGTVTGADDGLPIPGVTIMVPGTTVGTTTDFDGNYELTVDQGVTTLRYSFIGMETQDIQIGGRTVINVQMVVSAAVLDEVVVTALGISREKKALGYAATTVKGDEITATSEPSVMNALRGKVAGVNISSSSGAPGASTKVILRGYSSIGGNNQPLYIVDGSPISNTLQGTTGIGRAQDFGNRSNDINPEDILDITILKGASATALYGSRAANGIIMITTKKGKKGEGISVDFSSSFIASEVSRLPQMQNVFGQGWSGHFDTSENGSWGPKFDGKIRAWGNVVNNQQLIKPFIVQPNNLKDFYDYGKNYQNSISISGGNESSTFYASFSNVDNDGVVPTDADSYKRNTISLRGTLKKDKFFMSTSVNYINKNQKVVTTGQGDAAGAGNVLFQEIIQIPRGHSIVDMKDYNDPFYNLDNFYTPYAQNPYFSLNENGNYQTENRLYGNIYLEYKILKSLTLSWRVGLDVANTERKDWGAIAATSPDSPNGGVIPVVGAVTEMSFNNKEINSDLVLKHSTKYRDFTINSMVGHNVNERTARSLFGRVTGLDIPGFYDLSNSSVTPTTGTTRSERRSYAVFGQVDISYKDFLYMTVVARNDWSSTLPEAANSFFYPGMNLSYILTDHFSSLKEYFSFAKLRLGWGKTGNDAVPYQIDPVFVQGFSRANGFGSLTFPIDGINAFEKGNLIGNSALQPEITSELEIGTDLRFFDNKVRIDVAYYKRTTTDQILNVNLPHSTGYANQTLNFGKIENKGIELLVGLTPIKTRDFTWDITYTYAKNKNELLELSEELGVNKIALTGTFGIQFNAIVGRPLGVFEGHVPKTTPDGRIVVGANGVPITADDLEEYGIGQPDFTMGLVNQLTYKNWSMGFSFDYRKGGLMYSYTSRLNYFVGNATKTMYNDRRPFIVPNSVQELSDGTFVENTMPVAMTDINTYWNQTDNNSISREQVLDRTYLKLRDITLSYKLPKKWLSKVSIKSATVSVFATNVFVWTPEENNFIDPELTTFGNDLRGDFGEFAAGPTIRSFGFRLNVSI